MAGDVDAVHTALCRLRNELIQHVRDEREALSQLSPATAAVLRTGQQRLLQRVEHLLTMTDCGSNGCTCASQALHLTRDIARQARLETEVFMAHHRAPGPL